MKESKYFLSRLFLPFAFFASMFPETSAQTLVKEDFSSFPVGSTFGQQPQAHEGGWEWVAVPPRIAQGIFEVIETEDSQRALKVDVLSPDSGQTSWQLFCGLAEPLPLDGEGTIKIETTLRLPDLLVEMDFIIALVAPGSEEFQSLIRFLLKPNSAIAQFRHMARGGAGLPEEITSITAVPVKLEEGDWYRIEISLKPHQQAYDLRVSLEDGLLLYEALNVEWVSDVTAISGVLFRNRNVADLGAARFDLKSVLVEKNEP
jgi:hypothetical protein